MACWSVEDVECELRPLLGWHRAGIKLRGQAYLIDYNGIDLLRWNQPAATATPACAAAQNQPQPRNHRHSLLYGDRNPLQGRSQRRSCRQCQQQLQIRHTLGSEQAAPHYKKDHTIFRDKGGQFEPLQCGADAAHYMMNLASLSDGISSLRAESNTAEMRYALNLAGHRMRWMHFASGQAGHELGRLGMSQS